jgi:2-isopropylmalate synthase
MAFDHLKYRPFPQIQLSGRKWPDRRIERAPIWCSVDLRDGNQALIEPMSPPTKMKLFSLLVDIGFREIEVGFPAASQTDFDFIRQLIEEDRIPDHVTIQVLTQARPEIIRRTFEAVQGAKRVIVHLYNPTSPLQRDKVLRMDKAETIQIAVDAAKEILRLASEVKGTEWSFQYAPESFSATELDFAVEICNSVSDVWCPTPERPMTVTLPATVELATPNIYADQVQWVCDNLKNREAIVVSTHTHNDRGCAVAAAELAVMAGAQRVEGTLLGNGERSGNMDIVVMAMNLYSQGVDPGLDLSDMDRIVSVVNSCTQIDLHPRHPYCGDLIFTAFSGGHQDAIRKCLDALEDGKPWEVPYLSINPQDVGRTYQDVIRINSQSGKGGVTYVLETKLGVRPPRWLQIDFSRTVQNYCDDCGTEIGVEEIWKLFRDHCLQPPNALKLHRVLLHNEVSTEFSAIVGHAGVECLLQGDILRPSAFVQGLADALSLTCDVLDCSFQPLGNLQPVGEAPSFGVKPVREELRTIAYIRLKRNGECFGGVAIGSSQAEALVQAALSALDQIVCSSADETTINLLPRLGSVQAA